MRLREKTIALTMPLLLAACGAAYAAPPPATPAPTASSTIHKAHFVRHRNLKASAHKKRLSHKAHKKTHSYAPVTSNIATGMSFSDLPRVWQKIAICESSGNPREETGSYYGLFQIRRGWYRSAGLIPEQTTIAQQYALALHIWHRQGWAAWTCAGMLGIG